MILSVSLFLAYCRGFSAVAVVQFLYKDCVWKVENCLVLCITSARSLFLLCHFRAAPVFIHPLLTAYPKVITKIWTGEGERSRAILNHGGRAPIPPSLGYINGGVRKESACDGHMMDRKQGSAGRDCASMRHLTK